VTISLIGGRNWSTLIKPPTRRMQDNY